MKKTGMLTKIFENAIVIILEIAFFIICLFSFIDGIIYLTSNKKTFAKVVSIQSVDSSRNNIKVRYYNEYEHKIVVGKIHKLPKEDTRKLLTANSDSSIAIVYENFDYKYVDWADSEEDKVTVGFFIVNTALLLLVSFSILMSVKKYRASRLNFKLP